jgi:hypothetical protein
MTREILLVSSCTASKLQTADGSPVSAETLYTGQQHVRLMRGVNTYRAAGQPAGNLRFRILSALHGLIAPDSAIQAYNHSFSDLAAATIRREAHEKQIPRDIDRLLRRPYELGMLLLADPYLRACDLGPHTRLGGPLIVLCSPAAAERMPTISGLHTVTLSNAEARRFSCGMIALKGELGRRILSQLAANPRELDNLVQPTTDLLSWLDSGEPSRQLELTAA